MEMNDAASVRSITEPMTTGQTVQVMTSEGIKTVFVAAGSSIEQALRAQQQQQQQQNVRQILPKATGSPAAIRSPPPLTPINQPSPQQPQTLVRQQTPPAASTSGAEGAAPRVIVRDAQGRSIQLSQTQLQKLIASGALKQQQLQQLQHQVQPQSNQQQVVRIPQQPNQQQVVRIPPNVVRQAAPPQPQQAVRFVNLQQHPQPQQQVIHPPQQRIIQQQVVQQQPQQQSVIIRRQQPAAAAPQMVRPPQQIAQQIVRPPQQAAAAQQQPQSVRFSGPVSVGQRVSLNGKQYMVALNAAGQQVLTPL